MTEMQITNSFGTKLAVHIRMGDEADKQRLKEKNPHLKNLVWEGGYLILAQIEDTIVGYLWAFQREIPAPVEASELFINIVEIIYSDLRCQGLGSRMVQRCLEIAREESVYQVRAYCDIGNVPSHRLWLKNNFSISPVKHLDGSITGSFVTLVL